MGYFNLFENIDWNNLKQKLEEERFESLDNIKVFIKLIGNFEADLKSLDLLRSFKSLELVELFNKIRLYALELENLFPNGKLNRLSKCVRKVQFNRSQTLCLLCHMILCTLKATKYHLYWVNFKNWLVDGRTCALVYLETLLHYFKQSFEHKDSNEFINESVIFERIQFNSDLYENAINNYYIIPSNIQVKLKGLIGEDKSGVEVDFANQDIGYGITGTQEEILFGSSPEMCISMLFCDTIQDDEAIVIKGARRVAEFDGYGLNLSFKCLIPLDKQNWNERKILAIDSLDFSCFENSFSIQFERKSLERELKKAFTGFSAIEQNFIQTGHWGCGAFCSNKQLKAVIQVICSNLTKNSLIFYCFEDEEFYDQFVFFLNELSKFNQVPVKVLIDSILNQKFDENENIFLKILHYLSLNNLK